MTRIIEQLSLLDGSGESAPTPVVRRKDPAGGTSKDDEYNTPQWLWQFGLNVFGLDEYDLDPATNDSSSVPAHRKFTRAENGLAYPWRVPKKETTRLWLNPPFSQNADFAEKLVREWERGGIEAIVLDKHDHRVAWWWQFEEAATGLCLVRGYVTFDGQSAGYRFPVSVFYFGADYAGFEREFGEIGRCFCL